MKLTYLIIATLCLIHLAGLVGVIGWAAATQRIDRERVSAAVDLFRQPLSQEDPEVDDLADEVERDVLDATQRVEQMLTTESIAERLESEQLRTEMALRQLERTREEVQSLSRNLQLAQRRVEEQREQLVTEQAAFDERLREVEEELNDEGFRRTVTMFEALPPRQTKQMFIEMLNDEKREEVAAYLMAMQPRRATAVLREFQTADEVAHAVRLTELLRARGSHLVEDLEEIG